MGESVAQQLGNRIRDLREAKGCSIRELARRAGLSPELISRSERGQTEITVSSLLKLCSVLDLDLPGFFEFMREGRPSEISDPSLRRAVELLAQLPSPRRAEVIRAMGVLLRDDLPQKEPALLKAAETEAVYRPTRKRQGGRRPAPA